MTVMMRVPESAAPDEIVEVKILISHPMETGFRIGSDGNPVRRDIIRDLRCIYAGEEVFRAELHPAISANPFFAFHLRARASGDVAIIWADGAGEHSETRRLTVA